MAITDIRKGSRMSEYNREYCPVCEAKTDHEDGCCMECGRGPLESVNSYYKNEADGYKQKFLEAVKLCNALQQELENYKAIMSNSEGGH